MKKCYVVTNHATKAEMGIYSSKDEAERVAEHYRNKGWDVNVEVTSTD